MLSGKLSDCKYVEVWVCLLEDICLLTCSRWLGLCCLFSHSYSQEEYAKVSLRTWVNVVYGRMTAIDRKKKVVIVDGAFQVSATSNLKCQLSSFLQPLP